MEHQVGLQALTKSWFGFGRSHSTEFKDCGLLGCYTLGRRVPMLEQIALSVASKNIILFNKGTSPI